MKTLLCYKVLCNASFWNTSDEVTVAFGGGGMNLSSLEPQETKEMPQIPKWDSTDWINRGARHKGCKGIFSAIQRPAHTLGPPQVTRAESESLHTAALHVPKEESESLFLNTNV